LRFNTTYHALVSTDAAEAGVDISDGVVRPGDRLSEEELATAFAVSRNTLREAFRLVGHERLVEHVLNRGVFVRSLTAEDVVDIYRVRRLLEPAALRRAAAAGPGTGPAVAAVAAAVDRAELAARQRRWEDVATANIRFHQAIVRSLASERIDQTMAQLLAELRLAFHAMPDPAQFHQPYVAWNRRIVALVAGGDADGAERELVGYLDQAEDQLVRSHLPTRR